MSRNELGKALRTARLAYERETEPTYTITGFGALLRAVEILVERQDKPAEADSGIVAKLEQKIKMQHARIAELEKRIADLTAPMTVDGKTPGDVGRFEYDATYHAQLGTGCSLNAACSFAWENAAKAILRAFGQPSQTTTGAVEALRRVRHAMFPNPRGQTTDPEARHRMQIIDDELAKLKAKPAPASDHAHELGSCSFCDKQPANPSPVQYANEVARYGTEVCARAGLVRNDSGSPPDTSTESGLPDAVLLEKP